MEKVWKNTGAGQYSLYLGERIAGVLTLDPARGGSRAIATVAGETYTIGVKGFWGLELLISGSNGKEIMKVSPIRWYSSKYQVEHHGLKLKLEIRNNPLAGWALSDEQEELLSYDLDASVVGKVAVKISSSRNTDILYDLLLWYLFLPIAIERSGEQPIFTTLLPTQ